MSGDGFTAWAVYHPYCYGKETVAKYVDGCDKLTAMRAVEEPLVKNEVVKVSKKVKF
jgi:hypothetical protein